MYIQERDMPEQTMLILRPIGRVVDGPAFPPEPGWEDRDAVVEIDPPWVEALDGLGGFSHVWLLWWLDAYDQPPQALRTHPENREDAPLVGLFATRSPHRPNPIAMTVVRLLALDGSRLRVRGLDAREGTPILDIKPYIRRGDFIPEATMPEWIERLWQSHDTEKK
jgi:tRNA (adenine37-N6)-methyltransferase